MAMDMAMDIGSFIEKPTLEQLQMTMIISHFIVYHYLSLSTIIYHFLSLSILSIIIYQNSSVIPWFSHINHITKPIDRCFSWGCGFLEKTPCLQLVIWQLKAETFHECLDQPIMRTSRGDGVMYINTGMSSQERRYRWYNVYVYVYIYIYYMYICICIYTYTFIYV